MYWSSGYQLIITTMLLPDLKSSFRIKTVYGVNKPKLVTVRMKKFFKRTAATSRFSLLYLVASTSIKEMQLMLESLLLTLLAQVLILTL